MKILNIDVNEKIIWKKSELFNIVKKYHEITDEELEKILPNGLQFVENKSAEFQDYNTIENRGNSNIKKRSSKKKNSK